MNDARFNNRFLRPGIRVVLAVLACFLVSAASAQRDRIWYFGDHAGVDFGTGSPVDLSNGAMYSLECVAVICDSAGNLLMYTNGGRIQTLAGDHGSVWNRDHQVMPNGDMDSAGGCNSATQGVLFVPDPGNPDSYYLFTADCIENGYRGLHFNKIDMTLDSARGDLVIKDSLLQDKYISENVLGVQHANGTDYWIIAHTRYGSTFYTWLVTATGISGPVLQNVGLIPSQNYGHITASCDGSRIVLPSKDTYVYDFDPATGIVTNPVFIKTNNSYYYGSSFSPSGRYLYLSRSQSILQFDLLAPNVPASEVVISSAIKLFKAMVLGPDGRIYVSVNFASYLATIDDPDQPGAACNFVLNSVPLSHPCGNGLPNFVNTFHSGCSVTGVGLAEQPATRRGRVMPNPVTGSVRVSSPEPFYGLQLVDAAGRLLQARAFEAGVTENRFDAGWLQPGAYYLVLRFRHGMEALPLLKAP